MAESVNQQIRNQRPDARSAKLNRTARGDQHEFRGRTAPCQRGDEVNAGVIRPLQVFQHEQQRSLSGDRLQCFTELAQHALTGRAHDFAMQDLAILPREQRRKLCHPSRRFCEEDLDDGFGPGTAAQSSQRLEDRAICFFVSISFYALAIRDANGVPRERSLLSEYFCQCALTDAGFPGDEHDLPFAARSVLPCFMQLFQSRAAPDQRVWCCSARYDRIRNDGFRYRSDEPIAAPGQGLDEKRVLRAVSKCGAHFDHMFLHRLRLDNTARPHGIQQLIVSYQASGVIDQIGQDRKGLRRQ